MVRLSLTGAWGTIGSNQQGQPGEKEKACCVIDDVYLAGVKPGFQRAKRQVELKDAGLAVASIQLSQFNQRTLEDFGFSAEKGDIGQQMDAGLGRSRFCGLLGARLPDRKPRSRDAGAARKRRHG